MLDFESNVKLIKSDISEIKADLKSIGITLAVNTESLIHHAARTKANEERVVQVERWMMGFLASILLSCLYYFLRR